MKTRILITAFTALLLSACASHEGRSLSSTQDTADSQEFSRREAAHAGREINK